MMLIDVLPGLPIHNLRYGLEAHAKLCGQRRQGNALGLISCANVADLFGGKAGGTVAFPAVRLGMCLRSVAISARHFLRMCSCAIPVATTGAPLARRVPHVLELSADEQVRRIHARTIVAMMADKQPSRDGTNRQFVGDSMGKALTAMAYRERAITGIVHCPFPFPARIRAARLINQGPKRLLSFGIHRASVLHWWLEYKRKRIESQWWAEEMHRQYEAGNLDRAQAIRLSLIDLLYRLEGALA